MQTKWDAPFNVFAWSLGTFVVFVMLQIVSATVLVTLGHEQTLLLSLFTWFASTAAVSFVLVSRYPAALRHMLLVQGFACFYVFAISTALRFEAGNLGAGTVWLKELITVLGLFLCGTLGVASARLLRGQIAP
jgi:hypothetical protein